MKTKTTTPSHIPTGVVVAVVNKGIVGSPKNGPEGALVVAKVRKNKGDDNGYTLWTGHGRYDLTASDKVTWTAEAREAIDAKVCEKHDMVYRPWTGGYECAACWREYEKARNAAIKAGTWDPTGQRASRRAERTERVIAQNAERQITRERMIGNVIRSSYAAAQYGPGSKAQKESWARARLTTIAADYRVTIEQAANYAGIDPWEPLTWAEHRKAFPPKSVSADSLTDAA